MNGFVNLKVLDTGGMSDSEVVDLINNKGADALEFLSIKEQCVGSNRVFDGMFSTLLYSIFSVPTPPKDPFDNTRGNYQYGQWGWSIISFINISNQDTETDSYTEFWWENRQYINQISYSVDTSNASKYFISNVIDSEIYVGDSESIIFKTKFLYLPSEIISSEIRSLSVFFSGHAGNHSRAIIARIRLKDSDGRHVTISKTSRDVLIIEYTFTLFSS